MKESILKIYGRIQARKSRQISEIEDILAPLEKDHPEVKKVLDILDSWKPKLTDESRSICKGVH